MPAIRFKGVDYTTPTVYVQSDASATDLENTKVPTGQTIKSYLNSNNPKYVDVGGIPSQSSNLNVMMQVFNKLPITTKTVVGRFNYSGHWMFIGYRYGDSGQHGMILAMPYFLSPILCLGVNNGTGTCKQVTLTNA